VKEYSREYKLLEGLSRNNYSDVEAIYKENFGLVQTFILNNNGTFDDARDVFQEAMVVLFEKSKDPNFTLTCQLKTYLYSICRRLWLKKLQQQNRYGTPVEGMEDVVPVEDEIEEKEKLDNDFETMEMSMRNLGEPCKSLLEAFYIHKKQMVEIAEEFGYTNADNAKNQKYKCLMRLKKLFFAQYNKQS
jgi:RNA polymerase sigma factor (sigma-70 family)